MQQNYRSVLFYTDARHIKKYAFIRRCSFWRYLISQNCRISAAYGDVTDGYGVSVQKIADSVPSSPLKQTCTSLFLLFLCCTKGVEYGSLEALVSS